MSGGTCDTAAALHGIALRKRSDRQALAGALAQDVAEALHAAIQARGKASLVVSGGSTPVPMFEHLSRLALDWSSVSVTLADERVVEPDDELSNERMVRATLLQGAAAAARFVSLHDAGLRVPNAENAPLGSADTQAALARIAGQLAELPQPFDVLLLGMGDDGHTASLFPDAPELERAMRRDASLEEVGRVCVTRPASQPSVRLSMTARQLVQARRVWLQVAGEGKRAVLERALEQGTLPIARVLDAACTAGCERAIYWAP